MKFLKILLFAATMTVASNAHAAFTPISLGLVPPLQFPNSDFDITGLRASLLWGEHRSVSGLDVGLIGNITNVTFTGLAVSGIFNLTHSTTTIVGLQAAGLANINTAKTSIGGVQFALGINKNVTNTSVVGLQIAGLANLSDFTTIDGVQLAIYNKAVEVYGLQIGLINVVSSLHGLQIGLLNFNEKGLFSVSPILNAGF